MLPAPARQVSALVRNQFRCCSTPRHSTGEVARMPVFADDAAVASADNATVSDIREEGANATSTSRCNGDLDVPSSRATGQGNVGLRQLCRHARDICPCELLRSCSARIRCMTENNGKTSGAIGVGSRVSVTAPGIETEGSAVCTGVVIEDYADMVIDSGSVGRDWAPVHRWAIALDDGRLIFANDENLAAAD